MSFYQFLVPRLEGKRLAEDFGYYLRLVKKGVAGFIVFGAELESLRESVQSLQKESAVPLIIASDLEQGLGQQVFGGTMFPPAMAMGLLGDEDLRAAFDAVAGEALYAGINTIFAPVLDINTNPDNPIIGTRSFGEDPETVSRAGVEMIAAFLKRGVVPCGKHFPGHGDTAVDSHIGLPVVKKPLSEIEACELVPFGRAIKAGVPMIMTGHLSVAAIDPSGTPMTLSEKAVLFLRERLGFKGIITTDAMNMGAVGAIGKDEAALMALRAGVDIILHPADADETASYIERTAADFNLQAKRLMEFRMTLPRNISERPDFKGNRALSQKLSEKAIKTEGGLDNLKNPFVVVLNDDPEAGRGEAFLSALGAALPSLEHLDVRSAGQAIPVPPGCDLVVAVFSKIRAWKGGSAPWLKEAVKGLEGRAKALISFGSPYLIKDARANLKVYAWWDSEDAQRAAAEVMAEAIKKQ